MSEIPVVNADKLRDVAWALDALSKLTRVLLEPLAQIEELGAEQVEVGVVLTQDGEPMTPEEARKIIDWVDSDEMQADLRRWADALEMNDLQRRVAGWHAARFPAAQPYHVMLKAVEELGELAEVLNGHLSGGRDNEATSRRGNVPDEAADVAVCLMVLLGRWFPESDLVDHVEAKLEVLTDPDSGHRGALTTTDRG